LSGWSNIQPDKFLVRKFILEMESYEKKLKILSLSMDDIVKMFPEHDFKWEMYWDYRDIMDQKTFEKCMPELSSYKNENGSYRYDEFVSDWECSIEEQIWDWNWSYVVDSIHSELREMVEEKLKEDGIEFDDFEFDFCLDELYEIDWGVKELLERSKVIWNLCRFNNFDGFTEWETEEDWQAIAQFLKLYPNACGDREKTKKELEHAVNECMYTGSDLKLNFKSSMWDFLRMLETGKANACGSAVLHLGVNGSGSTEFDINCWEVELDKQVGDTVYDHWTWQMDWHYWVSDVYGGALNEY